MLGEGEVIMRTEVRREFRTLDGMRGVAAVAVVAVHASGLLAPFVVKSGYLAVDIFFLLSGFVLAHAYDNRMISIGVTGFMKRRLIRLMPLYLLGLGLGIIWAFGHMAQHDRDFPATVSGVAGSAALTTVFLPTPETFFKDRLFPLNTPAWSLALEMAINLLFAGFFTRITQRTASILAAVSFAALVYISAAYGSLDRGADWGSLWSGPPRVCFSFMVGLLMRRNLHRLPALDVPPAFTLIALAVCLLLPAGGLGRMVYDPLFIVVISPILVLCGASREPSPNFRRIAVGLGSASYAVYAVHYPLVAILGAVLRKLGLEPPFVGIFFVAFMFVLALLLDRYFDVPVRRWLTRRFDAVAPVFPGNQPSRDRSVAG